MAFDIFEVSPDLAALGVDSSRLREIIGGHTSAEDFLNKVREVLEELPIPTDLRSKFEDGLSDFLKKSDPVIRAIDYLSEKLEGLVESAGDTVKGVVQKTIEGFTKLKNEFKKDVESLIGKLDSSVEKIFDKLNQFRTETILGIRAIVGDVNTALEERINQLAKAASEILVKAKDFVSFAADEFKKKLFDPVLDRVEKIGDKLFADANKLVDKIFERVDLLVEKVFDKSGDFVQLLNELTVEEFQRSIEKAKADMDINPLLIVLDPNKERREAKKRRVATLKKCKEDELKLRDKAISDFSDVEFYQLNRCEKLSSERLSPNSSIENIVFAYGDLQLDAAKFRLMARLRGALDLEELAARDWLNFGLNLQYWKQRL
jgi:hypothetical protein